MRCPTIFLYAIDHPGDCLTQRFSTYRTTGLPDGRQAFERPRTRTALPHLMHEQAVRQEDQIHVAGLPEAFPQLTVTHAQLLLAVPVEALRASPAASIRDEDATNLPVCSIAHKHLSGFRTIASSPQDYDAYTMINTRYPNTLGEVPLLLPIDYDGLSIVRSNLLSKFFGFDLPPLEDEVAVEFQIADITPIMLVNVVEILRMSKPTVECKISRDVVFHHLVD